MSHFSLSLGICFLITKKMLPSTRTVTRKAIDCCPFLGNIFKYKKC